MTHSVASNAAFCIHSDTEIFGQSWLAAPPLDKVTGLAGDWQGCKEKFPCGKLGLSVLPPDMREPFGSAPLALPFHFSHKRTQSFSDAGHWLVKDKIKLPSCFIDDSTYAGSTLTKLNLNEVLCKKFLLDTLGLFDLNWDMTSLLKELGVTGLDKAGPEIIMKNFMTLLNTNILALRRMMLFASSLFVSNKLLARTLVLPRFSGKEQLKDSLLYSAFGTQGLFGPLSEEMEANVRMYRAHYSFEWRLSSYRDVSVQPLRVPLRLPRRT